MCVFIFFFFKQKTAYEMRISDWSSDVCSSDLLPGPVDHALVMTPAAMVPDVIAECGEAGIRCATIFTADFAEIGEEGRRLQERLIATAKAAGVRLVGPNSMRSEEHTSELQSLMRISYAVFCLKKKQKPN